MVTFSLTVNLCQVKLVNYAFSDNKLRGKLIWFWSNCGPFLFPIVKQIVHIVHTVKTS